MAATSYGKEDVGEYSIGNNAGHLWYNRINLLNGASRMRFTLRYGIDAPFWVAIFIGIGAGFSIVSLFALPHSLFGLVFGLYLFAIGLWMLLYSAVIKISHRYVILGLANVQAGDVLLDVGAGRGLLAIAAARQGCKVTAIDRWSQWDLGGNGRRALERNAETEGVPSIEILDGDVRKLPFETETFSVVVSNFVLHNIKGDDNRALAIREMWRVLRLNGRLVISDILPTQTYIETLALLTDRIQTKRYLYTFPFSRVIVAYKNDGSQQS